MWDLIVSVPDHCLSFYFEQLANMVSFRAPHFVPLSQISLEKCIFCHREMLFKTLLIPKNRDNIKSEIRSFKSNENIHKKEGGSYYVVSANKASSVTL